MASEKRERSSRRKFVREIGCALVSAPCIGRVLAAQNPAAAGAQKPAQGGGELLVAPCGLYCGACPMYLDSQDKSDQRTKALMQTFSGGKAQFKQEDLLCDGCIGNGRVASFCRKCAIRACAESKTNVKRCSDCPDFPCARITNFNNDGMVHHSEVLSNLRRLRAMGIKEWTKYEEDRWHCPQCRASLSWYEEACLKCGTKRSDRLFPLKKA